jgi:hypothetical protein
VTCNDPLCKQNKPQTQKATQNKLYKKQLPFFTFSYGILRFLPKSSELLRIIPLSAKKLSSAPKNKTKTQTKKLEKKY